ncbi:MAG TPA: acyl-[acyl-carrier-protein]--UDP-N-acetylglucosamine O-acyltransferase [Spirochaetia bacterium]|nr:acyl-[acyl-carrier-protein]--UDP-N-acetylglucosamine O-acyltransferase [Spirochaetia bacterium]
MNKIHPSAIIDQSARLENVTIGPHAIIEADALIGENTEVAAGAVIKKNSIIGKNNIIGHYAVIGEDPQDIHFDRNLKTGVIIGDNNIIREMATVHRSTKTGQNTIIGNNCFLMATSHIAHDCILHNNVILCNGSLMAGHIEIFDHVFISGLVAVHQFSKIGCNAMIAGCTRLAQDAPPYALVEGHPGIFRTINVVGLRRAGFSAEDRLAIKRVYNTIYFSGYTYSQAIKILEEQNIGSHGKIIIDFFKTSRSGVVKSGRTFSEE